ncbi:hypothetical protein LWI28_000699 [Acer negundo]|uniref:Uncharacterized protein n=1 Tax=Acer negundo TaxID=4023 RepID=A0AAD5P093_ACENE|nr:hypothetical protein LWI28_000699 [Acer negundo]KAK4857052.1 hypothetical protein QYF36_024096 [Acer negundo]
MASLTQVAFVLILCLVIMQHDSDHFVSGYGYYDSKVAAAHVEMHNRKVLVLSEKQVVGVDGQNMEGWELRTVPSGPDPLHHNANPKKPRTP